MAIQAAAESTDKGAEPTHHGRSPQRHKCRRGVVGLIGSGHRDKQPRAIQRRSMEAYADGALVR